MNRTQFKQSLCVLTATILIITKGLSTPLNGFYTINSSVPTGSNNFQSISEFANNINLNGVSGNVIATVVSGSGPYTGKVVFNDIPGIGPNSTVTLDGNGEVLTALTTSVNRHILRLTNCQYFTITNLNIIRDTASTGEFYGIQLLTSGNHLIINNCTVAMTGTTSTLSGGIIASGSETSIMESGDFHDITIGNNNVTDGGYAISVIGILTNLASEIVIHDNTITNYHSDGVYLVKTNGTIIYGNYFDKSTNEMSHCNAIQLAQTNNYNASIYNNTITVSQTSNDNGLFRGIYLFGGSGHKVYNNVIRNIQLTSGDFTAIEIRTGASSPFILFNTINLDQTQTSSGNLYGIKEEISGTQSVLRNNLISITQPTSGYKSALFLSTNTSYLLLNSDYNNFYIPGGNIVQQGNFNIDIDFFPTLEGWQVFSGLDPHSHTINPAFVSSSLPQPTNDILDNEGVSFGSVLSDFTGVTRGDPPDIGAYEFSGSTPEAPDSIFGPLSVCANSAVSFYILPVSTATSYHWDVTGAMLFSGQGTVSIEVGFTNLPTLITCTAINNTGTSPITSISIAINPLPIVYIAFNQGPVCIYWPPFTLTCGTPPNGTYSGPSIQNNVFYPWLAGPGVDHFLYSYTDNNGCTNSVLGTIVVSFCTGDQEPESKEVQPSVYPNPISDYCQITLPGSQEEFVVYLFDSQGRICLERPSINSSLSMNLKFLKGGIYTVLTISKSGKKQTQRILKI